MKNIFFIALSFLLISCQTDNEKFISAYDGKDDNSSTSSSFQEKFKKMTVLVVLHLLDLHQVFLIQVQAYSY